MVERMAALGHRGVMARTFHAAALAQLRHFWPSRHDGAPLPATLDSKLRLLVPLVGRLPGGYRFTPAKDVADTIEWAKVRRIRPERWVERRRRSRAHPGRPLRPPLPRLRAGQGARRTCSTSRTCSSRRSSCSRRDAEAAALVRSRKRWFSVDEYQDTNPLARAAARAVARRVAAIWRSSATRTRRSTRSPAPRRSSCCASPSAIRARGP